MFAQQKSTFLDSTREIQVKFFFGTKTYEISYWHCWVRTTIAPQLANNGLNWNRSGCACYDTEICSRNHTQSESKWRCSRLSSAHVVRQSILFGGNKTTTLYHFPPQSMTFAVYWKRNLKRFQWPIDRTPQKTTVSKWNFHPQSFLIYFRTGQILTFELDCSDFRWYAAWCPATQPIEHCFCPSVHPFGLHKTVNAGWTLKMDRKEWKEQSAWECREFSVLHI